MKQKITKIISSLLVTLLAMPSLELLQAMRVNSQGGGRNMINQGGSRPGFGGTTGRSAAVRSVGGTSGASRAVMARSSVGRATGQVSGARTGMASRSSNLRGASLQRSSGTRLGASQAAKTMGTGTKTLGKTAGKGTKFAGVGAATAKSFGKTGKTIGQPKGLGAGKTSTKTAQGTVFKGGKKQAKKTQELSKAGGYNAPKKTSSIKTGGIKPGKKASKAGGAITKKTPKVQTKSATKAGATGIGKVTKKPAKGTDIKKVGTGGPIKKGPVGPVKGPGKITSGGVPGKLPGKVQTGTATGSQIDQTAGLAGLLGGLGLAGLAGLAAKGGDTTVTYGPTTAIGPTTTVTGGDTFNQPQTAVGDTTIIDRGGYPGPFIDGGYPGPYIGGFDPIPVPIVPAYQPGTTIIDTFDAQPATVIPSTYEPSISIDTSINQPETTTIDISEESDEEEEEDEPEETNIEDSESQEYADIGMTEPTSPETDDSANAKRKKEKEQITSLLPKPSEDRDTPLSDLMAQYWILGPASEALKTPEDRQREREFSKIDRANEAKKALGHALTEAAKQDPEFIAALDKLLRENKGDNTFNKGLTQALQTTEGKSKFASDLHHSSFRNALKRAAEGQ